MRFQMPVLVTAILFTLLCISLMGFLVLLPIACIEWAWNNWMASARLVPVINGWQAALLYMALATLLYISGLVRIEIETGQAD